MSVGLIVRAPSPVACDVWCDAGIIDDLLAEDGVFPLPPARGDRDAIVECRFDSGAKSAPSILLASDRGGGWTDFAFAVLELALEPPP